jgi:hypothetical protein
MKHTQNTNTQKTGNPNQHSHPITPVTAHRLAGHASDLRWVSNLAESVAN